MSVEAMNWAYQQTVGRATAKSVLISLANQANQDGQCWPSLSYTMERCELSRRAVISNLSFLEEKGFIEKEIRPGDGSGRKTNKYTLNMTPKGKVQNLHIGGQGAPDALRGKVHEGNQQGAHNAGQGAPDAPKQSLNSKRTITSYAQDLFEKTRTIKPRNPNDNRKEALKAWNARIREGINPEDLLAGRERYARWCIAEKTQPRYIKHDRTFFGPNEHWKLDWSPEPEPITLPRDNRELWAIRERIGLEPYYDDLKSCHAEIQAHLVKHPELREAVA